MAGEELAEVRHEYVAGAVYAMVGTTLRHNQIAGNLFARLNTHLAGSGCRVYISDVKVRADEVFYYPDVVVTCESARPNAVYLTAPALIVEVLSESTEGRDRLEKWSAYRALSSLREYVLIAQDRVSLEIFRRGSEGWEHLTIEGAEEVELASVAFKFPLQGLYADPFTA